MTPAERNALLFLSVLILLGASVRLVRSRATEVHASRAERQALAMQRSAVDSVRGATRSTSGNRRSASASRASSRSRIGQNGSSTGRSSGSAKASGGRKPPGAAPGGGSAGSSDTVVDLDLATRAEIEALPWIGPVLAERIVTNRDSLGPFGSMEQFQRVYGVGPGMARRLEGRVTFSQTPRHFRVEDRGKRTSSGARARPPARPRAP